MFGVSLGLIAPDKFKFLVSRKGRTIHIKWCENYCSYMTPDTNNKLRTVSLVVSSYRESETKEWRTLYFRQFNKVFNKLSTLFEVLDQLLNVELQPGQQRFSFIYIRKVHFMQKGHSLSTFWHPEKPSRRKIKKVMY